MSTQLRRSLIALLSSSILLAGGALAPAGAFAGKRQRSQALTEGSPVAESSPVAGSEAGSPPETGSLQPPAGESTPRVHGHRHGKCELSLEASPETVMAGEPATLHGTLACPEGTAASGETIAISVTQRVGGVPSTSELPPATTEEDGSFEVTTAPLIARSIFIAHSPLARHGARAPVKVTPKVTLDGPAAAGTQLVAHASSSTHTRRTRFTFAGTVDPAMMGTRVALQYQYASNGRGWHTVAFSRVGAGGRYSFVHAFGSPGEVSVRVIAHPKGELPAASEPLSYEIVGATAHADAPFDGLALTLSPPPSTVQAGATVTFSGTLAPAPTAPSGTPTSASPTQVVYLERANPGGFGFHVVASATVSDGSYALSYTFAHPGTAVMRVKAPAGAHTGTSAPVTITVTAAP
jgi:hypothetical protein